MNKAELVSAIAEESGLTKKNVETFLNATIKIVVNTLNEGEKVVIVDFGTWEVRHRKERKGRNPRTKEEMIIPATSVPVFKAGKGFRTSVKSSDSDET